MIWIKRNLLLLIGIIVAVGLMVGASVLLVSGLAKNSEISSTLDALKSEVESLNATEPYPSPENIQALKADATRLQKLMTNMQQVLISMSVPVEPTDQQLKQLLETTIFDLQREAEAANVVLPPRYDFSFGAQRLMAKFPERSHLALATQISEVKSITSVLLSSGVQALSFIRRVPGVMGETSGTTDYLDKAIVTNKFNNPNPAGGPGHYATFTPYQIGFKGFSGELEKVLDGLRRDALFIVVKKIDIKGENAEVALPPGIELAAPKPMTGTMPMAPQPTVGGTPKPAARSTKGTNVVVNSTALTILDEKPLDVSLLIEVVKLHKSAK